MSLSLSRNTLAKVRERGLSEYITLREDIALKDPLGEVPAQKAAASKITKRMSALMSRPTASKQKQQKEQFLSKRKIDRATRERNLEFNIGQNPQTNGTGGGNATFAPQGFNTMSAVSDPNINTAGSLFSKPVPPPMDEIQKSKQQQITPVT